MKILLIAPPWLPVPPPAYGGTEWVVSCLADGLTDAGHDVTLLASGGSHTRARLQPVFEVPPFGLLGDARIETLQALTGYLARREYDLIHDHTAAVGPALAAVAEGPPVVHTLHHDWLEDQVRFARLVTPPVRLVAVSEDQAARAPGGVPIAAVVHNGIPLERYRFCAEKSDFLLFVGRATPDKGPDTAIEVAQRLGRPLMMCIKVNEPDEHEYWRKVLQPLVARATTQVDIVPNARHEQKADLMARAAAVLVPIRWPEPFGLVMPEANASGTPVVAFGVGAVPEIIADGESGFVVPAGDVDAFCDAVERATELDPVVCRAHAAERFSAQRMVANYERVYEHASR